MKCDIKAAVEILRVDIEDVFWYNEENMKKYRKA